MELARSTSRGGLSVRSVFTFALAAIVAAILWVTFASPATHAADASWSGSAILYEGNKYNITNDAKILKEVGLESAEKVYVFVDPEPDDQSFNTTNSPSPPSDRKIRLIYFEAGIDASTATEAKYKDLTYVGPGKYTNPSSVTTLTFNQIGAEGTTSCDIDTGLGWIICPVTTTLAKAMDFIYDILTGFLKVRPIETGQDNALYRAWRFMQAFANVAFVIVFLVIIYSQLTSIGISSYGIKKLIPRLIIAALLVNLSYFISSIAVDISNILGYSMQDIFITMRNGLVGDEGNEWELLSWESITGFALSGGTLAVAGGTAAFIAVADLGPEVIFLILPALVVALLAVLVALVVLAARQAIIILLVILSPLAFVAYLLPNTEKWFEKWRDTFFTMLLIFPAFSVVFGGSQLAATAIIQTADSINLIILGMLVQVAPLFITPLLLKLGGGLLARIGGMINDPNKGMVDRTRNFVKDRTDNARARRLGDTAKPYELMKRNAQFRDRRRRQREGWKGAHTTKADARWANSTYFQQIDQVSRYASEDKAAGESESGIIYEQSRVSSSRVRTLDTRTRMLQEQMSTATSDAERQWENSSDNNVLRTRIQAKAAALRLDEAKKQFESQLEDLAGGVVDTRFSGVKNINNYRDIARDSLINSKAWASRLANAQAEQQQLYAKALQDSPRLVDIAGGILEHGDKKALASAKITIDHALEEAIKNIQNTSSVPAGDAKGMRAELDKAIAAGDLATTVAYVNKLAESSNTGVNELRGALRENENSGLLGGEMLRDVKQFINANAGLNASAEDIGSWSRDVEQNRRLADIVKDTKMWANMTPIAFASQKLSSQIEALKNDGVDQAMAQEILQNPAARGGLKAPMREELERIVKGEVPLSKSDPTAIPDDETE